MGFKPFSLPRYLLTAFYVYTLYYVQTVDHILHMTHFGSFLRETREALQASEGRSFSLRQVAARVGIEPAYLSKIERGEVPPPSEATIARLADVLRQDSDLLLGLAGKVSSELQDIILKRPQLFASLLRELKDAPEHAILNVVREVRDGQW